MTKWIRLIAMALAIVATVVIQLLPGANASAEWVSLISVFALAAWNAWKNNDFTFAAKVGTKVMNAIKDGKITEDEVKDFLKTKDE
jgi:hypothetical protein